MANYGWAWPHVVSCCHLQGADVAFFLEAPSHTRHYIALALRGWEQRGGDDEALAELGTRIPSDSRKRVLADAWGCDLGNPSILHRLDGRSWSRASYGQLAEVMANPRRRAILAARKKVSAAQIAKIAGAREELMHGTKGALVVRLGPDEAAHVADALVRLRPDLGRPAVHAWLEEKAGDDSTDFPEQVIGLLANRRLPSPPWKGSKDVRPLRTVKAMGAAGVRYRNCLKDAWQITSALAGQRCFYVVSAPSTAIVCLARDPLLDAWHVCEALGARNRPLGRAARHEILGVFAAAGFAYLPDPGWVQNV